MQVFSPENRLKMEEKSGNPYDMDGTTFDSDKYLQKLLKVSINNT